MPILNVSQADLIKAFKTVGKHFKKKTCEDVFFSFTDKKLNIQSPEICVSIPASGDWSGQVIVSARFVKAFALEPPVSDPVNIQVIDNSMIIETLSVPCTWNSVPCVGIVLPPFSSSKVISSVRYNYTPEEIRKSGLTEIVSLVEKKLDLCIAKAHEHLEVFEISENDILHMIGEKMKKMPTARYENGIGLEKQINDEIY